MEATNNQATVQPPPNAVTSPSPKANSPTYSPEEAGRILRDAASKARALEAQRDKRAPLIKAEMPRVNIVPSPTDDAEVSDRARKCWDASGVPKRYLEADLRSIGQLPNLKGIERYAQAVALIQQSLERPCMFAMLGNCGSGKTWMACGLVREFCRSARSAIYLEAMDFFIALQETYNDGSKASASAVEQKYIKPDLLVLDAMEERGDTAWSDRMLTRLVNKRYTALKSTLLISNEKEDEFNERIGPSIVDRIRDDGGKIECNWPSLRGRIGRD